MEVTFSKTMRVIISQYDMQCVLCLCPIGKGDTIVDAGPDLLSGHEVWTHLECGDAWLTTHPERPALLSTGWQVVEQPQRCHNRDCIGGEIVAGGRAYRVISEDGGHYNRICLLCWMRRCTS